MAFTKNCWHMCQRSQVVGGPLPSHTCTWSSETCSWSSECRGGCWQRPGWHPGSDASSNKQNQRNSMWWPGTRAHESTCSAERDRSSIHEAQDQFPPMGSESWWSLVSAEAEALRAPWTTQNSSGSRVTGSEHRLYHSPIKSSDVRQLEW